MAIYATVQDVDDRWFGQPSFLSPLNTDLRDSVQRLLDDAHTRLYAKVPDLDARVTAGLPTAAMVAIVVSGAVLRYLRNPDGYRSASLGAASWSRDTGQSIGRVDITAQDLADLGIAYTTGSLVTSVRMAEPDWRQAWHDGTWG